MDDSGPRTGSISKQWLQVTVKATENTGLAQNDVFYYGNAIGEVGDSTVNAIVNATDEVWTLEPSGLHASGDD